MRATVESDATTLNPTQSQLLSSRALAAVNLAVATASESALKEQQAKKEEELGTFPDDVMEYMRLSRDSTIKNEVYLNSSSSTSRTRYRRRWRAWISRSSMRRICLTSRDLLHQRKKLITAIGFVTGVLLAMGYSLLAYRREA